MAIVNKTFLDFEGLNTYDAAIKNWANSASQKGYKTVHIAADGSALYFYKKENAVLGTDTPDQTINLGGSGADKKVWLTDTTSTAGTDYSKIYKLYQGENAPDAVSDPAVLIGTINIPKDYLVKNAEVKTVTAADKAPGGIFENNPDFQVGDKYIDFTVNAKDMSGTESHLYINCNDLMDAISVAPNATEIQLALSNSNELSASVVEINGTKIGYLYDGVGAITETVTQALTRLDGSDSTTGSVAKKIKDAIEALDTGSDIAVTTYTAGSGSGASRTADIISFLGSIKEQDGLIAVGTADTINFNSITESQINSLFV